MPQTVNHKKITILILILLCGATPLFPQRIGGDRTVLLILSLNGSHYSNSVGGRTDNGCEAWSTLLSSGETVCVSRCDEDRLLEPETWDI